MRTRMWLGIIALLAVRTVSAADGPITSNPIPEPIVKRGIAVEVKDLARLPDTRGLRPADQDVAPAAWARVSYVRDLPDGRRFANDSRGLLYLIDSSNQPHTYLDVGAVFPLSVKRLESGFIGFVFHPEFATNGLFYTVHSESGPGNPKTPDFIPPGYGLKDVTYHNVITEWHATNPAANTFEGTRRELLRTAHVVANLTHPMGAVEFNPTAKPGDADYGLLYTSGSDHGFSNGGGPNASNPAQTQRLDSIITAILRIDPRSPSVTGGRKGAGRLHDSDGEQVRRGRRSENAGRNLRLRVPQRPPALVGHRRNDVRLRHRDGPDRRDQYRPQWRELRLDEARRLLRGRPVSRRRAEELYPLPPEILDGRVKDGFTYPVVVYDHDEGRAVTDGFAYHGRIAALKGKFVFGDIFNGRVFVSDLAAMKKADDGIPQTVAPVEEVQLYVRDASGKRVDVSFRDLIDKTMGKTAPRADLHISRSRDGELFLTSRQDGMIRMLVPDIGRTN